MTVTMESAATPVVALDDLKDYLKISLGDEDGLLGDLLAAATDMAERFTGQILVDRAVAEVMPVTGEWQRLSIRPVRAVTGVMAVAANGAEQALAVDAYAIDIDRNGDGWVRVARQGAVGRVKVAYRAGIAANGAGVPEAIRHGIIRLAGEYHARREGLEVRPPAAVSALWRPWRRMRLS
ncbi:phage gp6-like head-tail connector protein [Sphingobium sufflavum]|uniref:head-tail connector protein n=1 Tax=Sphingobium sufflavum TaxID=1129547 RepID=UPI001F26059C|nr:phage gp6-like head-tail connector protein [Sphingobium sufflavum]MCE7798651.1 phage gp6-like head-tail connector protein [Sphingobium sufflavum]